MMLIFHQLLFEKEVQGFVFKFTLNRNVKKKMGESIYSQIFHGKQNHFRESRFFYLDFKRISDTNIFQ